MPCSSLIILFSKGMTNQAARPEFLAPLNGPVKLMADFQPVFGGTSCYLSPFMVK
jgi:hypothetical protein